MPTSREEMISALQQSEPWDIVVIGGGAVGMGVALDAVSRGYRCALFEQHDFAKGTSSRSTKLIHGGVRYLAQGDISLVREALRERGILLHNAPELVKPLRFIVPCYSHRERWYYWAGMKCYDALSGRWKIQSSSQVSTSELKQAVPGLKDNHLRGGVAYYDAQFDDARLVITVAQRFRELGGIPLNYFAVDELIQENGRVAGVGVRDQETGATYRVHAKAVVNAAGVFSDHVRQLESKDAPNMIAPSQGIHLVVDQSFLGGEDAIMIPKTKDGRVLFGIPWLGRAVLGTTDTPVASPDLEPKPLQAEVDYLLEHFQDYFSKPLRPEDVKSSFAGLRPLVKPKQEAGATSKISREHRVVVSQAGLISILGGKWTTFRKMAQDVVESAMEVGDLAKSPSRTEPLSLRDIPTRGSLNPQSSPTPEDTTALVQEGFARTPEDVLARRFRCLLLDAKASGDVVLEVAQTMARELGHSQAWIDEQVESYQNLVRQYCLES